LKYPAAPPRAAVHRFGIAVLGYACLKLDPI